VKTKIIKTFDISDFTNLIRNSSTNLDVNQDTKETEVNNHLAKSMDIEPKKILLVDDDPDMLMVNSGLLKNFGFQIFLARDGLEALEIVKKNRLDLIILDLMLPKIDGFLICGMLKRDARYFSIPIIIVSARYDEQDKKKAKAAGADDYIPKPFNPEKILSLVSSLFGTPLDEEKLLIAKSKLSVKRKKFRRVSERRKIISRVE
jgi:DNA-binding response OmpR family regulator